MQKMNQSAKKLPRLYRCVLLWPHLTNAAFVTLPKQGNPFRATIIRPWTATTTVRYVPGKHTEHPTTVPDSDGIDEDTQQSRSVHVLHDEFSTEEIDNLVEVPDEISDGDDPKTHDHGNVIQSEEDVLQTVQRKRELALLEKELEEHVVTSVLEDTHEDKRQSHWVTDEKDAHDI